MQVARRLKTVNDLPRDYDKLVWIEYTQILVFHHSLATDNRPDTKIIQRTQRSTNEGNEKLVVSQSTLEQS